jgi:hypothetical protein
MDKNDVALIGGFKVITPKSGKYFGTKTVLFNLFLRVNGEGDLHRNIRITNGEILPPVTQIAPGRWKNLWTTNGYKARMIYEAVVKNVEEGKLELDIPLLDNPQDAYGKLMYKLADIPTLLPEIVGVVG